MVPDDNIVLWSYEAEIHWNCNFHCNQFIVFDITMYCHNSISIPLNTVKMQLFRYKQMFHNKKMNNHYFSLGNSIIQM